MGGYVFCFLNTTNSSWAGFWISNLCMSPTLVNSAQGLLGKEWREYGKTNPKDPGAGHGNPLWYSCLESSMDIGAWPATIHGVSKSWTQLKRLSAHAILKRITCKVEYDVYCPKASGSGGNRELTKPAHHLSSCGLLTWGTFFFFFGHTTRCGILVPQGSNLHFLHWKAES